MPGERWATMGEEVLEGNVSQVNLGRPFASHICDDGLGASDEHSGIAYLLCRFFPQPGSHAWSWKAKQE
jgi:hypothetical protein